MGQASGKYFPLRQLECVADMLQTLACSLDSFLLWSTNLVCDRRRSGEARSLCRDQADKGEWEASRSLQRIASPSMGSGLKELVAFSFVISSHFIHIIHTYTRC